MRLACHVCGSGAVVQVEGFASLPRVTSDCKPWPAGGVLLECHACSAVQKAAGRTWEAEVERVYGAYDLCYQTGGVEQTIIHPGTGLGGGRSERIVGRLRELLRPGPRGSWLDVGCGNGDLLGVAARALPGWALAGQETNAAYRDRVSAIPGVRFYAGGVEAVPGRFDVVTTVHVLEHVPAPVAFLATLKPKLAPGGALLVEVPDRAQNPFDLLIVDHATHFSGQVLDQVAARAGLDVETVETDWVPKELSLLVRDGPTRRPNRSARSFAEPPPVSSQVRWLEELLALARKVSGKGPLGVLGTSIGAIWLYGALGEDVSFFVDEDPRRAGTIFGRPVWRPSEVPPGATVILALPPPTARVVAARLRRPGIEYLEPPPFVAAEAAQ